MLESYTSKVDEAANNTITTKQDLLKNLEENILTGRLRPGEKLPSERHLAERFDLSRTAVREILRSLIERHLVKTVPGRGAYVLHARASDVSRRLGVVFRRQQATPRHLMEARKMLEGEAVSLACVRAEPEHLKVMELALSQFERSPELIQKTRYDVTFHMSIAKAARNPVIETMFRAISDSTIELILRSLADPEVYRRGTPYHQEIYEGIRDGDQERAITAMTRHLSLAESLYGEDFDRSLDILAKEELQRFVGPDITVEKLLEIAATDIDK
jgi:GntR family transcriptional repressor for pyruvate dehydrogenase complex